MSTVGRDSESAVSYLGSVLSLHSKPVRAQMRNQLVDQFSVLKALFILTCIVVILAYTPTNSEIGSLSPHISAGQYC